MSNSDFNTWFQTALNDAELEGTFNYRPERLTFTYA